MMMFLFLDVFQEHLFLAERQRSGNQRGGLWRGKKGNGGGGGAEDTDNEEEGFVTSEVNLEDGRLLIFGSEKKDNANFSLIT
ncbi:hypothetical protein LINGRAHAP2_LOCUS32779 [Linum grandiflorum]